LKVGLGTDDEEPPVHVDRTGAESGLGHGCNQREERIREWRKQGTRTEAAAKAAATHEVNTTTVAASLNPLSMS
jgi:hypothetical protein